MAHLELKRNIFYAEFDVSYLFTGDGDHTFLDKTNPIELVHIKTALTLSMIFLDYVHYTLGAAVKPVILTMKPYGVVCRRRKSFIFF